MAGWGGRSQDATPSDLTALRAERSKLLARLAQIDRVLNRRDTAVIKPPEKRG